MLKQIVLLIALVVLGSMQASAATTLKFAHVFAPDSLEDRAMHAFADQVAKETKGEIKVQIFPAGQLGGILSNFQGLTLGTLDVTFIDITLLGYIKGHEEFFVGQVPYLFHSVEEARRIYNSPVFEPLYERLRKDGGIRVLAVRGDRAARGLNTTKGPIFEPADGKGIKIRVLPLPVAIKTFEAWGFNATPVNYNELFLALKQGVVEGQDNGLDVTVPAKFYEVAKYYAFTDHVYSIYGWYISDKTWAKIPAKYHPILVKAAQDGGDMITRLGPEREKDDLNTMLKAGNKITIPNRSAFEALSKDVYKQFEGSLWPAGLVARIKAAEEAPAKKP